MHIYEVLTPSSPSVVLVLCPVLVLIVYSRRVMFLLIYPMQSVELDSVSMFVIAGRHANIASSSSFLTCHRQIWNNHSNKFKSLTVTRIIVTTQLRMRRI